MLTIFPLPAFQDNYIWMIHDQKFAVVVDPGEATPVRSYLTTHNLQLTAILCTHHHHDHTGGISELVQVYNVPVYGPLQENVPCITHRLGEGDRVELVEPNISLEVIDIPGHTRGHIAYLNNSGVFCGDTLFGCGCGKLFEGTATQLWQALQRLAQLPDASKIYCGHEYTEANIRFALACEPANSALLQRQKMVQALRAMGQPSLPSTMGIEKATNPFLRCTEPEIIASVLSMMHIQQTDEISIFTALRLWKDRF